MKDIYILGIESSCDETSCSIVKNGSEEIATIISSQIDIHKDYGGVVPEIASRNHVKNITFVIEECLEKANMCDSDNLWPWSYWITSCGCRSSKNIIIYI